MRPWRRWCAAIKAIGDLLRRLPMLEGELRRLSDGLDFVRTHIGTYVGDGIALTYLADQTPIFVNANDFGPPFNMLNGGRYEEENADVLLSFVREDTVFLDIGANVGFFALLIGRRIGAAGRVLAFEPHPLLSDLLWRNVHVNGLRSRVECFRIALSDRNGSSQMLFPHGHLGGGHVNQAVEFSGFTAIEAELKRLDDVLGGDFACDLVKIDVEGHEIRVLDGMRAIVANSPRIKILFEKLAPDMGSEPPLEAYFAEAGFELFGVGGDARLVRIEPGGLSAWGGYVLAARPGTIEDGPDRARFSVQPGQLFVPGAPQPAPGPLCRAGARGELLCHGPYWFLRRGLWRFRFTGEIRGEIQVFIQEGFGRRVLDFPLSDSRREHVFLVTRDLLHFECALRVTGVEASIEVVRFDLIRES